MYNGLNLNHPSCHARPVIAAAGGLIRDANTYEQQEQASQQVLSS
jgi:hypothetical protein